MFSDKKGKFSESALLIAGLIGLVVGLSFWFLFRSYGPMMSGRESLDRHFIEQMIPHHEDAVSMSELALTKAEHPELKMLAQDIKRDQTAEIGQMREWYKAWYGTEVPEFSGGMMGGGMGHGMMMGAMGDSTDLERLAASERFDEEFIEQMIPHHQMAIMMAQMLLRGTDRQELRTLGENIVRTQSDEIGRMREWYGAWYGK